MLVTVAICTWNRAKLLDQTLTRMRELRIPDGVTWELLVVNNNCTDETDVVIANHARHLPLRRLFEPKQGLSNARNCAASATRGELLIWTDDDVLVDPDWIAEYVSAADRFSRAGFFGGTVDPWFAEDPPHWMRANFHQLEGPFAIRWLGPDIRVLAKTEQVFGANMAFRTKLMKDFRFDSNLGRVGKEMLSGEETELVARLQSAGWSGVWVGTARVRHYIPRDRLTVGYLWRYFVGAARTQHRMSHAIEGSVGPDKLYRWARRHYWLEWVRERMLACRKGPSWIRSLDRAAWLRGMMEECRDVLGRRT